MLFIALLTGCSDKDESTKLPDDDTVTSPVEIVEEVVEEEPEEEDLETRVSFYGVGDNLIHTSIFQSAIKGMEFTILNQFIKISHQILKPLI